MKEYKDVDVAIIGAGIVGIASAYYICQKSKFKSVLLIDSRDPMSYTSAQSGDNYRNWWPNQVMADFSNASIGMMKEIAQESSNLIQMKQSGYALATRQKNIDDLIIALESNYHDTQGLVRFHTGAADTSYPKPLNQDWQSTVDGVDVLTNNVLIKKVFPAFSSDVNTVLHIRRAGDFSSQQMGTFMLQKIKAQGGSRLRGHVAGLTKDNRYQLEVQTSDGAVSLKAEMVVNAAGPYVGEIATMLNVKLPIENIFQQKVAFRDSLSAVPRNQPFSIDLDQASLAWTEEELSALNEDSELSWLTQKFVGGVHCRPEGAGDWVKLGWAYNRQSSQADNTRSLTDDPQFDPNFPEIVIRGASRLNPNLAQYADALPTKRVHYGGYYTMTKENWPLIGPLDKEGAFVVGAMSGFGSMCACAAGSLCANWVVGEGLPDYAQALSPSRYQNVDLIRTIRESTELGLL